MGIMIGQGPWPGFSPLNEAWSTFQPSYYGASWNSPRGIIQLENSAHKGERGQEVLELQIPRNTRAGVFIAGERAEAGGSRHIFFQYSKIQFFQRKRCFETFFSTTPNLWHQTGKFRQVLFPGCNMCAYLGTQIGCWAVQLTRQIPNMHNAHWVLKCMSQAHVMGCFI